MKIKEVSRDTIDICSLKNDSGKIIGVRDCVIEEYIKADYSIFILAGVPYLYDNGVFVADRTGAILKSIIKMHLALDFIKSTTISRIYNLFLQDYEIEINEDEINNYPAHWVAFKDCLYDVVTNTRQEYRPEYRVINRVPYAYEDVCSADTPGCIDDFLSQAVLTEDIQTVLEFIGYCLTRNNSLQKMVLLKGGRATGKSVLLSLIEMAAGKENISNVPLQSIEEKFHSIQLLHKLVNICADINAIPLKTTNGIKLITGGDYITDSYKGRDLVTFKAYCKCIFSANTVPLILDNDVSNAFYKRLCIIEMNNPPERPDRDLLNKLRQEIPHLIYMALNAYRQAIERGNLFESAHSQELVKELYIDSDSTQAFLEKCTEKASGERVTKAALYREYTDFCENEDRVPLQKQNFNRHMRTKGFVEYRYHGECWKDVRLIDWKNDNPFTK